MPKPIIQCIEPIAPKHIYIDPVSNRVHLLMPIVSGQQIGMDNTCKSVFALQEYFGRKRTQDKKNSALDELVAYQEALEFDLHLLNTESQTDEVTEERVAEVKRLIQGKKERLEQIKQYIAIIKVIEKSAQLTSLDKGFPEYPIPLKAIMEQENTNLYSMLLRPDTLDNFIRSANRVFLVNRTEESPFYAALHRVFHSEMPQIIPKKTSRSRLIEAVVASAAGQEAILAMSEKRSINFNSLRIELQDKINEILGINILLNVEQNTIDILMGFTPKNPATVHDYIDSLLGYFAVFDQIPESPFYNINENDQSKAADKLSILTQFFLGLVNIYCISHEPKLSTENFAEILEKNQQLSDEIAELVKSAFLSGASIEDALLDYLIAHRAQFQLGEIISADREVIKQQFIELFKQISASPHFDEFTLIDSHKKGPFIVHQSSICVDLAEFIHKGFPELDSQYFADVRAEVSRIPRTAEREIPHRNEFIGAQMVMDWEKLSDEQLEQIEKFPIKTRLILIKEMPKAIQEKLEQRIKLREFLLCVAQGKQQQAENILKTIKDPQALLTQKGQFTDFSNRTFNCSAYEYAYWAMDTHMRRMLEEYMEPETKAILAERVSTIRTTGLAYSHNGQDFRTPHFDFSPLLTALRTYQIKIGERTAWKEVGLAQRDIPAHVAQEYCRLDRSFSPRPEFNEPTLPRVLTFFDLEEENDEMPTWYPVVPGAGPGFGVAMIRGENDFSVQTTLASAKEIAIDLSAIEQLAAVRTADLEVSYQALAQPASAIASL